ncbi:MAG: hypothetical protein E7037_02970 [Verrucomicrobia bacterium]|nr:hypothetical protein [Verrucomicrobiota bacterium]
MIESFADKDTARIFARERVKRFSPEILERARKKLVLIATAQTLSFLRMPPSNRLEALHGDRDGFFSIRVNNQWRIVFRFQNGNAYDVELCDYH